MVNSIIIGLCFYLIDPANGRGNKDDAVRVEKVGEKVVYRWWNLQQEWTTSTNEMTKIKFARLFKPLHKCPSQTDPQ